MIIVFDLDDTLYEELTFVKSGFEAVAKFLSTTYGVSKNKVLNEFIDEEKKGRGAIFDKVLIKHKLFTKKLVNKCRSIYRLHQPKIKLPQESIEVLKALKQKNTLYIVTDGNKIVQRNKCKALNVSAYVKRAYTTHSFGVKHAKPSPYCFLKIVDLEKCLPSQIIYVGDNISKDFVGIKPLGFKTVRLLKGNYVSLTKPKAYHADYTINNLSELIKLIDQNKI